MSHCHNEHSGHGHGHGHGHDDEHDHSDDITPALQSSLYEQINFDEITTLNESIRDSGKAIVKKPWTERLTDEPELASDADEQLLMTVPYVPSTHDSQRLRDTGSQHKSNSTPSSSAHPPQTPRHGPSTSSSTGTTSTSQPQRTHSPRRPWS